MKDIPSNQTAPEFCLIKETSGRTRYEAGTQHYGNRIDTLRNQLGATEGNARVPILEELEIASLRLNHLHRRKEVGLMT